MLLNNYFKIIIIIIIIYLHLYPSQVESSKRIRITTELATTCTVDQCALCLSPCLIYMAYTNYACLHMHQVHS